MAQDSTNMKKPYRKPYAKKRKQKKRQAWQNAGSKVGSMAYSAYKTANRLAKLINVEMKALDSNASTTLDYNGYSAYLNTIAQGTGDNQRIGDSLKCQRLTLVGKLAANTSNCSTRILIVEDKQNALAITDLLTNMGSSVAPYSQKTWDNRFKSRILYDELFDHIVGSDSEAQTINIKLDLGHHTQFLAGGTTIVTGAYKIFALSNRVTTNLPTFDYVYRLEYSDD